MHTHTQYYEQKRKNIRFFLFENFPFLVVKFAKYLNKHVFVMGLNVTALLTSAGIASVS